MKTKGMKIIDNIARTFKRPMELDDIVRASNDARSAGGSFTANDVADMLRWAFNVAVDATGNRDALRMYKDRAEEFEEKAEWYDNLESNTPADIFDAIVEKDWREATFQDEQDIAEKIRECGRSFSYTIPMAV